ncbi:DNA modification methylase [Mycobacteroides abscessus subsp. abscessus]|uniref:DNA-methyltransferase n=1 Tax=Mycobacteriaceae TaxID=1762 RepID=UPI0006B31B69|nr:MULTISPECIES: site-specific DNA-methyltransferase [Mycobacteriaceae]KAB7754407.1 DNA adenine methylase [Mycolicibacterium mucogenicum DSM 44124]SLE99459.1 DNA modification methylase [Mycobacteroides abscessus subsp. abscessus]
MTVHYQDPTVTLHHGKALDVVRELPDEAVNCIVTSPPYYNLRDYAADGQYGLEATPAEYVENQRILFAELRRVLASDGTLWINLADTYTGRADASAGPTNGRSRPNVMPRRVNTTADLGPKQKLGLPWKVAFALQDDGWILRNDIIWHKNSMPESVTDRLSARYEHIFLFSKSQHYWFDLDAIREQQDSTGQTHIGRSGYRDGHPSKTRGFTRSHRELHPRGKNPGDVWTIATRRFTGAHFAVFPPDVPQRCILAGCKPDGTVLDPFSGSGTTGLAAQRTGRRYVGIDIRADYLDLSLRTRLRDAALDFGDATTTEHQDQQ